MFFLVLLDSLCLGLGCRIFVPKCQAGFSAFCLSRPTLSGESTSRPSVTLLLGACYGVPHSVTCCSGPPLPLAQVLDGVCVLQLRAKCCQDVSNWGN